MGTALITGASAGIGLELAKQFAKDGHNVFLVARRTDRLQALAIELKALNPAIKTRVLSADLSMPNASKQVFDFASKEKIEVDYLVNNAGFGSNGKFVELNLSKELEMIDLNIRALVELTHLFLPKMIDRKSGKILNVGSVAGFQPGPFMSTYYASKAFVNSFSEALHQELVGTGVTCTVLAPGPTRTEFGDIAKVTDRKLFNYVKLATAEEVALRGYKAMMAGSAICVPGFMNNMLVQTLRVTPRNLVRKIASELNKN